jgi:hypothetical protein
MREDHYNKLNFAGDGLDEFHMQFRVYLSRLYRIGLILTGRPQSAHELLTAIYISAFENYSPQIGSLEFEAWLRDVLQKYLQSPTYLHFCLTESGLVSEPQTYAAFLN